MIDCRPPSAGYCAMVSSTRGALPKIRVIKKRATETKCSLIHSIPEFRFARASPGEIVICRGKPQRNYKLPGQAPAEDWQDFKIIAGACPGHLKLSLLFLACLFFSFFVVAFSLCSKVALP